MLRHYLNDRRLLTIEDLAARYGVTDLAIRQTISRAKRAGKKIPIAAYCGRMALYDPEVFDRVRGFKEEPSNERIADG